MKFVQFKSRKNRENEEEVYVNVEKISCFYRSLNNYTTIVVNRTEIDVLETPEDIMKKILDARNL